MKTHLLTLSLFLLGIGLSNAQEPNISQSQLTNEIQELCSLSPEQVAKVQPLIQAFEQKRDETYKKYKHNPVTLKKEVKQNRWDYEVSLIGILTPEQMGLLKAFDQRNTDLMTRATQKVTKVNYLCSTSNSDISKPATTQTTVSAGQKNQTSQQPIIEEKPAVQTASVAVSTSVQNTTTETTATEQPKEQTSTESILTNEIKELCSLTPEQVAKIQPLVQAFEQKRDETYKKYRNNLIVLKKEVKQNRWDYEVSLIGILNPEQMGLVKAFDQRNLELMSGSGTQVIKVDYLIARN